MGIKSQVVTVIEDRSAPGGVAASAEEATLIDTVSTVVSTNSALTGAYGLLQRCGLFVAGMAVQSKLKTDSFNFLK